MSVPSEIARSESPFNSVPSTLLRSRPRLLARSRMSIPSSLITSIELVFRTQEELRNDKSKNDELINRIIEIELNKIESLTWTKLKQEFNKISGDDMKTILNNYKSGLADNIEAIFKFRNLFLHGNVIEFKNKEDGSFEFEGKSKFLSDFIKKHKLEKEDITSKDHFIEL